MALFGDHAVQLLHPGELGTHGHDQWAALTARSGDVNIFAHHWFMDAALRHTPPDLPVRLAIVERIGAGWIGVVPLVRRHGCGRWPTPNWQTWLAPNQFLGAPLVEAGQAGTFWAVLLQFLDQRSGREMFLQCRELAWDGPVCAALTALCNGQGRKLHVVRRWDRPAQIAGNAARVKGGKTIARIKSLERRLAQDHGTVAVQFLEATACPDEWMDHFLELERAGWKGRGGSALACDRATEGLFREIMSEARRRGYLRCATLTLDGRPIAMSSWFAAERQSYGFKMAYDENYRGYAPGKILMRHIAVQNAARAFDSCAPSGAHSSRSFWPDSREIVDCAIAIGSPARRAVFGGMMAIKAAYRAIARN